MLYEQREKSIEQRGAFEEELIGSGGTSLEACAPSKLVSELLSEGVGRCDNVLGSATSRRAQDLCQRRIN